MSLLYICLFIKIFDLKGNKEVISHCHDHNGTSVIKMHIHLDEFAISAFSFSKPHQNPLKTIKDWFGSIFDDMNREIQKYGVQFHCDFSELGISKYPIVYDKTMCYETNPPGVRGSLADNVFKSKFKGEYGNRLIIFFCPNIQMPTLYGHLEFGACNNTMGFLYGPLPVLKMKIEKEIFKAVFKNTKDDDKFNMDVCKIARKCVDEDKSVFGQYFGDLKAVRHISSEEFILPNKKRVEEHDLYDDIYVDKYKGNF
ncbi:hypothetical protein GVAV_002095 [Gurleya vavrai]